MTKELDIKYLAGLLDGEGCITIYKKAPWSKYQKSPTFTGYIIISMTAESLIKRLQVELGGHVRQIDYTGTKNKDQWRWRLGGAKALILLKKVLPYLQVKKKQTELVIALLARTGQYKGAREGRKGIAPLTMKEIVYRQKIYDKCKKLNKRGR